MTERSSTASPRTTATTASRPGCSAAGSRSSATEAIAAWPEFDWTRPGSPARTRRRPACPTGSQAVEARVRGLTAASPPADAIGRGATARRLLADLLDWHRREEKSQWWRWFELKDDLTIEQLVVERDALAGLAFIDETPGQGVMLHRRYRFEPQDHGFHAGDQPARQGHGAERRHDRRRSTTSTGIVELKRSPHRVDWPHPTALIPIAPIDSQAQKQAMLRVADAVIDDGIEGPGRYRAIRDLLLRRPPRRDGRPGASRWSMPGEDVLVAASPHRPRARRGRAADPGPARHGQDLRGRANDPRPRGAGKTRRHHRAVAQDDQQPARGGGRRAAAEAQAPVRAHPEGRRGRRSRRPPRRRHPRRRATRTSPRPCAAGPPTSWRARRWLFARPEFDGAFDVLFVDEASQLSLANAVAVGTCARSIVLIGDPNQLPMVTQGVHPEGAAASSLEHIVGDAMTRPRVERGLFLPDVAPDAPGRQRVHLAGVLRGPARRRTRDTRLQRRRRRRPAAAPASGVRWIPTAHTGNGTALPRRGRRRRATPSPPSSA